jgi:putative cell wall-binding protein
VALPAELKKLMLLASICVTQLTSAPLAKATVSEVVVEPDGVTSSFVQEITKKKTNESSKKIALINGRLIAFNISCD